MHYREQKIRFVLYWLSVLVFFMGLPSILSYALGYKFNPHTIRFTKTGLIALKSQPAGAGIYLEKKLFKDKTPATINELLPGAYHIKVALGGYYPWVTEVRVEAGKVARFEKIILFPTRPDIEKVNSESSLSFWLDDKRDIIYYVSEEDNSIYKSELDTEDYRKVSDFPRQVSAPIKWRLAPDGEELLCFDLHQLLIVPLYSQSAAAPAEKKAFPLEVSPDTIVDAFWHSDSYHIIVVTDKKIEALEAMPSSKPVNLLKLNKDSTCAFYDLRADILYFLDSQQAADGKIYDNIYRLDLSTKFYPFRELMKLRTNGQGQKVKKNP
ncbi:MAG: PEGA domain-containing protein [Candidatus Omnitrophota bacterium]|nr:PEGA domain-containing protein [Candidatus Omnitrophota bacterium]